MATVNKNFRIKDGLIVEGTTGTINGEDILTTGSSTTQLPEGDKLYYTNERVDDRVANLVEGGTGIAVSYDDNGNVLGISADFTEFSTTDIVEGDKEFFTEERAQDAVAQALANGTHTNITVDYDDNANAISLTGAVTYTDADARNAIQAGTGIDYNPSTGEVSVTANAYDTYGSASAVAGDLSDHISDTSTHGVSGDIVGTTDAQVLTNKTINDELLFTNPSTVANDGGIKINDVSEDMEVTAYTANLHLKGQTDVTVTAVNGDIVLNPDGAAYINSVSAGNQVATNAYVDNAVSGIAWKEAVHLYAASNVALTGDTETLVLDGHPALESTHNGYRVLLVNQSTATQNGIYVYADNGTTYTLTRSADADDIAELSGAAVFVIEGTVYGGTSWVQSNHYADSFDDLVWTQFSGGGTMVAGTGISLDGLEISIDRTTVDTWYDEAGAATTAYNNAVDYADTTFVTLDDLPGQLDDYIPLSQKGEDDGVATLDAGGDVPASQLDNVYTAIENGSDMLKPSGIIVKAGSYYGYQASDQSFSSYKRYTAQSFNGGDTDAYQIAYVTGRLGKLSISASNAAGDIHSSEITIALDTSLNAYVTEYGVMTSNGDLYEISVTDISSYGSGAYNAVVRATSLSASKLVIFTAFENFAFNPALFL